MLPVYIPANRRRPTIFSSSSLQFLLEKWNGAFSALGLGVPPTPTDASHHRRQSLASPLGSPEHATGDPNHQSSLLHDMHVTSVLLTEGLAPLPDEYRHSRHDLPWPSLLAQTKVRVFCDFDELPLCLRLLHTAFLPQDRVWGALGTRPHMVLLHAMATPSLAVIMARHDAASACVAKADRVSQSLVEAVACVVERCASESDPSMFQQQLECALQVARHLPSLPPLVDQSGGDAVVLPGHPPPSLARLQPEDEPQPFDADILQRLAPFVSLSSSACSVCTWGSLRACASVSDLTILLKSISVRW